MRVTALPGAARGRVAGPQTPTPGAGERAHRALSRGAGRQGTAPLVASGSLQRLPSPCLSAWLTTPCAPRRLGPAHGRRPVSKGVRSGGLPGATGGRLGAEDRRLRAGQKQGGTRPRRAQTHTRSLISVPSSVRLSIAQPRRARATGDLHPHAATQMSFVLLATL